MMQVAFWWQRIEREKEREKEREGERERKREREREKEREKKGLVCSIRSHEKYGHKN
jgi:hypothetical protein